MRCLILTLIILAAAAAPAQVSIPGTFSSLPNTALQPSLNLTTPTMTLGNGLTPPVVSTQPSAVLLSPAELQSLTTANYFSGTAAGSSAQDATFPTAWGPTETWPQGPSQLRPYFDFGVAPAEDGPAVSDQNEDGRSLGEVAAELRHRSALRNNFVTGNLQQIARVQETSYRFSDRESPERSTGPAHATPAPTQNEPDSTAPASFHPSSSDDLPGSSSLPAVAAVGGFGLVIGLLMRKKRV